MQYLRALCPELPIPRKPPGSDIATCGLSPTASRHTLPSSQHASYQCCYWQVLAFLSLRQMSSRLALMGFDLFAVGMVVSYITIRLHKPIRLMQVPPALHWNLKMPTTVTVDDGGNLIVSISVVHRCHSTTACNNMVDHLQACTAHAASATDISMQGCGAHST